MKIPRSSTDFYWLSALRRLSLGRIVFSKQNRFFPMEANSGMVWLAKIPLGKVTAGKLKKKSPFLSIFCLPSDRFCNFWST